MNDFPWNDGKRVYSMSDCPKCEGRGFVLVDSGAAVCDCAGKALAERILKRCGIPEKHAGATVREYDPQTEEQRAAKLQIIEWARTFGQKGSPQTGLYLYGPVGTGKSHLACAIMRLLVGKQVWSIYRNSPELIVELRAKMDSPGANDFAALDMFCDVPLLVLDDLGTERLTDYARERLHVIFDRRYRLNLPTIITSNMSVDQLGDAFDERIADRIAESCTAVWVWGPSYRRILAEKRTGEKSRTTDSTDGHGEKRKPSTMGAVV